MTKKNRSYTTNWFKSVSDQLSSLIHAIICIASIIYILFIAFVASILFVTIFSLILWIYFAKKTWWMKYVFKEDWIQINNKKTTKFFNKEEIARVRRVMRSNKYVWTQWTKRFITQDIYYTTSTSNLVCIYLRNKSNIIISPAKIERRVLHYYDSDQLADRY